MFGGIMTQTILSLLLSLLAFTSVFASSTDPMINIRLSEYDRLRTEQQNSGASCLNNISQVMGQGMQASYQAYVQQADALKQNATTRFETLKQCRNELRSAFLDYKKAEDQNNINRKMKKIKVARAESEYRLKVLEFKESCQSKADQEFIKYKAEVYKEGVINDPTKAVNFNNRINSHRKKFFQACYQSEINNEKVLELGKQLQINLAEIDVEMESSADSLASMVEQTRLIQKGILDNCEDQEELNKYNQSLSEQIAARGLSMTKQQQTMGLLGAMSSCLNPGTQRSLSSSPENTTN